MPDRRQSQGGHYPTISLTSQEEGRQANHEYRIEMLEKAIVDIKSDTHELLTLFRGGKAWALVFKWCVGVGAACATLWAAIHFGRP